MRLQGGVCTQAWGWCRESLVGLLGAPHAHGTCAYTHTHTSVCSHLIHRQAQARSHVHRTPTLTYVHTNVNAHALTCANTHILPQTTHYHTLMLLFSSHAHKHIPTHSLLHICAPTQTPTHNTHHTQHTYTNSHTLTQYPSHSNT